MKSLMPFSTSLLAIVLLVEGAQLCFGQEVRARTQQPSSIKTIPMVKQSSQDLSRGARAAAGGPNILLIMLDDVGFGDTGTFGGPVETPQLDQLAAEGLRYNQFHTKAVCSPTRAALLSGRNPHHVGFGAFGGLAYPGYDGIWKKSAISIAEVLRRQGYSTAAFGKWHNTPNNEITPIGPFDRWPTGLGFEYYYGNMIGMSSQWEPPLWRNTVSVAPPATPEQGYNLTADLANEAIAWIHTHTSLAPDKPYFVYFAPGAAHTPHHVSKEWIEKYRGRFDQGWDKLRQETFIRQKKLGVIPFSAKLTLRPKELPAWDSLSGDEKRLFARQMEVYAAFVAQTDDDVGRLLQVATQGPQGKNTLVLYIVGDNGDEGGVLNGTDNVGSGNLVPHSIQEQLSHIDELGSKLHMNLYASGWAWAGSTPFQWVKSVASHFGGTRNPLIVSWPARIKDSGGMRRQFIDVIDIAPTLYEIAGIKFVSTVDGVKQLPLDGTSFAYTFDHPNTPSKHHVQYFEFDGNRAVYQDGWLAAARHTVPWMENSNKDYAHDRWELYHVADDFSEANDVALQNPARLRKLQALFDVEARKNNVYPLGAGTAFPSPPWFGDKREFIYYSDFPGLSISAEATPDFSLSHSITADVEIPSVGASGVIIAAGGRDGGFSLYVKEDHLIYENNFFDKTHDFVIARESLPVGKVELRYEFIREDPDKDFSGGIGRLYTNKRLVGEAKLRHGACPSAYENFDIGQDSGSPVSTAYTSPFKFTGTLQKVTVTLKSGSGENGNK